MQRNRSPRREGRRGSAIVEFALMATLFLLLLGGIMDFSRVFYVSIQLNDAAMAGVQYAMLASSNYADYTGMQTAASNAQPNLSGMTAVASSYCVEAPTTPTGDEGDVTACRGTVHQYLQVATAVDYPLFSTYFSLPGSMNLKGLAVVRLQ